MEQDARASAPLVTLFERDDAIAVPLLSQLRLAGYDVRGARTPVELFDLLGKNLVSLVLVDLGAATAGRREFWVALDAQRRGRSLQVVTFRFVNPIGDLDFEFEPSARAVADVEAHGAHEFGRIIEAVRQRVPLHGPNVGAGVSYTPDGAIQPIGAALGLPPTPYNQQVQQPVGMYGSTAPTSFQAFPSSGPAFGVSPLGIAPSNAGFGAGPTTLAATGYQASAPTQAYPSAPSMAPSNPFGPYYGSPMEMNGFAPMAPGSQPSMYSGGFANGQPGAFPGGVGQAYPSTPSAMYGQPSAPSMPSSFPGAHVSPFSQPAASNPFGLAAEHSPFAQPYERNPFGQEPVNPFSAAQPSPMFNSAPSQPASMWPSASRPPSSISQPGPNGSHPAWGGSGGYIGAQANSFPDQWSMPDTDGLTVQSPAPQSDGFPSVMSSSPSPLPPVSAPAFQDAWYPPDEADTPTSMAPEIQFKQPIPAPYTPPALGALPPTYENPFLPEDSRSRAGASPFTPSQPSQFSQPSRPSQSSPAIQSTRFGAQDRPWDTPRAATSPDDPLEGSTARLEPNTIPGMLAAAAQAASAHAAKQQEPAPQAPFVSATPTEQALGKVLIEGELLSPSMLATLQHIQGMLAKSNMPRRLGELALMFKFLSADQLLAAALVSKGLVTPQQIAALGRVKQELAAQGVEHDLPALLLQNNVLPSDQLREIQTELAS